MAIDLGLGISVILLMTVLMRVGVLIVLPRRAIPIVAFTGASRARGIRKCDRGDSNSGCATQYNLSYVSYPLASDVRYWYQK
jgi:hypothetical protein